MRAVLHQDIVSLARCLLALPRKERRPFADLQVKLTDAADRYRVRFGRAHALYGNGTLASCCSQNESVSERRLDDPDYADCMIQALEAVVSFRKTDGGASA